jgi:hypothetical protein
MIEVPKRQNIGVQNGDLFIPETEVAIFSQAQGVEPGKYVGNILAPLVRAVGHIDAGYLNDLVKKQAK